jgi:hypothetical protein
MRVDVASQTGLQRVIPAWEWRHLRLWAGVRLGGAGVLAGCGVLTIAYGGHDAQTFAWAAAFIAAAAVAFGAGLWELGVARSQG